MPASTGGRVDDAAAGLGGPPVAQFDRASAGFAHEMTFIPAAGYGFQPASGIVADVRFDVETDGHVAKGVIRDNAGGELSVAPSRLPMGQNGAQSASLEARAKRRVRAAARTMP